MDIKSLHKEGHSIKQIVRQTGHSRNTVRRVLRESAPSAFQTPTRSSCLDPYKNYLQERWQSTGLNAVRLMAEIQPMGYTGSIATLRRFLHTLKPAQERLQKLAAFRSCRIDPRLRGDGEAIGKNGMNTSLVRRTVTISLGVLLLAVNCRS